MADIEDLILNAWSRMKPRLLEDPAEFARRLARRNGRSLSRPPRAWCLAIRASDRRLAAYYPTSTTDDACPERAQRVDGACPERAQRVEGNRQLTTDHRPLVTDHSVFL